MNSGWIFAFFGIFAIGFVGIAIYAFRKLFYIVEVEGCSMAPCLESGDRVLVLRYSRPNIIKRGSVVMLESWTMPKSGNNNFFIKRVVGLPNDTLAIYETKLIALKEVLSRDTYDYYSSIYAPDTIATHLTRIPDCNSVQINQIYSTNYRTEKVPPGHLFIKGDWPFGGDDSLIHGPILYKKIRGVMLMKLNH